MKNQKDELLMYRVKTKSGEYVGKICSDNFGVGDHDIDIGEIEETKYTSCTPNGFLILRNGTSLNFKKGSLKGGLHIKVSGIKKPFSINAAEILVIERIKG